jgi:NitT/TauT family transport system substrate-binding protein
MKNKIGILGLVAGAAATLSLGIQDVAAQGAKVTLSLPAQSILFSPIYVAADQGYFTEQGLDLKTTVVAGPGTVSAVLSGSAEFGVIGGSVIVAAAAKNQRLLIIGNTQDKFTTEMVLRKEAVDKIKVAADANDVNRAKGLRNLTIAVDAVGGLPHSYLRYIAKRAGIDPETGITVTPMQPPSMVAALKQGTIDGMVFSQPFTLVAVNNGGVLWFSGVRGDFPETAPHAYNTVFSKADYCGKNSDNCQKVMNAVNKALTFMKEKPDAALASVRRIFPDMDPALLSKSFEMTVKVAQTKASVTDDMMKKTLAYTKTTGILNENADIPRFQELYTNKYN